ncbi:MAG: hypothetical protein WCE62_17580 [Polyangiales bacterium]
MSSRERACIIGVFWFLGACDQLGNPPQYATAPTVWDDPRGRLETSTRSFRNESTIRRLVSDGLGELDHADPSIGPSQTLTIVSVAARRFDPIGRRSVPLVTVFKFSNHTPILRNWSADVSSRRWTAAFATPEPPAGAVTSVAP